MKFKSIFLLIFLLFSITAKADMYEDYKKAYLSFSTLIITAEKQNQLPPMFDDGVNSALIA